MIIQLTSGLNLELPEIKHFLKTNLSKPIGDVFVLAGDIAPFAVGLYNLIKDTGPDFWIFGHHYFNGSDFEIGKTLLAISQLGYMKHGEQQFFNQSKSISI